MFIRDVVLVNYTFIVVEEVKSRTDSLQYILKLTLAVLGPVVILGLLGAVVLLLMRRVHRKRLLAQRCKLDPEQYYAGEDLLRATAAGDSTLRVCIL